VGVSRERILALDISSVCTGWALFEGPALKLYGSIRLTAEGHGERLTQFATELSQLVRRHRPTRLVFEKPFFGPRRNAFRVLMMYVGVLMLVHWECLGRELDPEDGIEAHRVKRVLGMRKEDTHQARKRAMVQEINRLYGLALKFKSEDKTKRVSQDDIADAVATGRAWMLVHRTAWFREEA
jgi:Holliday junction resolvasome RuvABC endonuclease subunit